MGRAEDGEHGVADATTVEPNLAEVVERYNASLPDEAARYDAHNLPYGLRQEALSAPLMEAEYAAFEGVFAALPPAEGQPNIARLRSCRAPESYAWLTAVPNDRFKTKMSQESFRAAVELRLGIVRSAGRRCAFAGCGAVLDACGAHAASCKASGMAKVRHDHIKETLGSVMRSAGMMVSFEPAGLVATNGRLKPADISVSGLSSDRVFSNIDVTVVNPACPTHLQDGQTARLVANNADARKRAKYERHARVVPFSIEVYGTFSRSARWVCRKVVENYTAVHPDIDRFSEKVQSTYALQVISVALQRGNAQMILSCGDPLLAQRLNNSVDVYAPPVHPRDAQLIGHD
jgi:hypothetical protein